MALDTNIVGSNLDANGNIKVALAQATTPASVGAVRLFSENDAGAVTGTASLMSPETDLDFRLRSAQDVLLDYERFSFNNQFSGKHTMPTSSMTATFGAQGAVLNSGSITSGGAYVSLATRAFFGSQHAAALYVETGAAVMSAPIANNVVEFGLGVPSPGADPADGVFFRISSAGVSIVASSNAVEVSAAPAFTYTPGQVYKWGISLTATEATFWVDDVLLGKLERTSDHLTMAGGGQWFASVRNSATTATAMLVRVHSYAVSATDMGLVPQNINPSSRVTSYQGLGGFTQGGLSNYANSANPTAAVPTNTTAALGTGAGGQFWETDTLAANTDGIVCSFQNGSGVSVNSHNRRMVVSGVRLDSYVQTTLTGGGYNAQWCIAFGHNNVSLATSEGATTKAPRRIPLGVQTVAAAATATTQLQSLTLTLRNPIVLNPGEFIALVKKKVGTAPSAGVIAHVVTLDYCFI